MKFTLSIILVLSAATASGQTSATWTGAAGNWSDGTKWSTTPTAPINGQPLAGNTYNATLDIDRVITLDTPTVIQTLDLTSGTITGANTLTLNAGLNWSGGTVSGSNAATDILNATGGMSLSGGGSKTLTTRTLNHGDGVAPSTATWTAGTLALGSGAIFNNKAAATFTTNFDGTLAANGAASTFNNQGVFTKSGGTGTTLVSVAFNNSNTVNINSGSLSLSSGGSHSGLFNIPAGRSLLFSGGSHTLGAGSTFSDTATSILTISGGNVTFSAAVSLQGTVAVSSGTATFNNAATINTLQLANGVVNGSGTVTLDSPFIWTGGTVSGSNAATDILNVTGGMTLSGLNLALTTRTLSHGDGVASSSANWTAGTLALGTGAVFNNKPAATFTTDFDGTLASNGGAASTFNNQGVFTKSGGTGTTLVNVAFNNSNTVNINSGSLSLSSGGSHSGLFNIPAGRSLLLSGGSHTLGAGSTFSDTATSVLGISGGTVTFSAAVNLLGTVNVSSGTTTFNNAATLNTLQLTSGVVNGSGTVTLGSPFIWTGGNVNGSNAATDILNATGGMTLSSGASKTLTTRTLNHGNGVSPSSATWTAGLLDLGTGAIFNNKDEATFTTDFDGTLGSNGTPSTFNNQGVFTKSGGTGTTLVNVAFNNSNTVNINTGTLNLSNGGSHSGLFYIPAGRSLVLSGGNHTLGAGSTFSDTATSLLAISGGAVTFSAAVNLLGTVTVNTGTAAFNNTATLNTLQLTSGIVNGSGTVTLTSPFIWTGGNVNGTNAATDIINVTGGMTLSGTGSKTLTTRTLNHGNGVAPSSTTWTAGPLDLGTGAVFNNKAAATFTTNFDGTLGSNGAASTFNNQGVFTKSGGTGTTLVNVAFNNSNTVNINTGSLSLSSGGSHSGLFNIPAGRSLLLSGGSHTLGAGSTFNDTATSILTISAGTVTFATAVSLLGTVNVSSGTATFNNSATLNTLQLTSGVVNGPGTVSVASPFIWTGGNVTGTNAVTDILNATGGMTLSGSNKELTTRTLNHGDGVSPSTANWTAGNLALGSGAVFNNKAAATFTTNFDGALASNGGITPTFSNQGVFTKSGGPGTTSVAIAFNNSGTVNVNSGTLALNGGVTQHSATSLTGGTWNVSTGAAITISTGSNITTNQGNVTLDGIGSSFAKLTTTLATNQGGLTLKNDRDLTTAGNLTNSGVLRVEDSTTLLAVTGSYTQSGGSTTLVGGAQLTATSFNLNDGTLNGTGTLNGNLVATGSPLVAPGLSVGSLTVTGNATLSGTLAMEIGRLVPGTGHDQLLVTGGLTVGGNLSLALINGFIPAFGQSLTLADAGSTISGSFTNVASGGRLASANGTYSFGVQYGPGSPSGSDKIVLSAASDNIAPVLTLPANITKEATGQVGTPVTFVVSANDAFQGPVTATANPASGSGFVLGPTTVNVTASDVGGNTANSSFTVNIVDTTPPNLTVPASPVLATTTSTAGTTVNFSVSATDIADPVPVVVATPNSGSVFPLGDTQVNVTATDASGNQTTGNFIVRVTGLPDIGIKETTGAEIADGGTSAFGPVALGKSSPAKSFTVRNDGAAMLTLGAFTTNGAQPSDFPATPPLASSLAPGQSTTFSVTFTPAAMGQRAAALHLASNDPDVPESVFDITLTGAGFNMKLSAVTIVPAGPGSPAAISGSVTGGPPNSTVRLQASTDFGLTDPWVTIFPVPLDSNGAGLISGKTDPGSTGAARDFFRLVFP